MFNEISYMMILGKPLIMYLGLITISLFIITGIVGYLVINNKTKLTFKHHKIIATIAIVFAIIHGSLGMLAYF